MKLEPALQTLENEAIYVLRETYGQFEKPILLFSGGKDSIVLAHLAARAFYPGRIPFKLLHVDTGHNFPETLAFRDHLVVELGCELVIAKVQDLIDDGTLAEEEGFNPSRNALQIPALLRAIKKLGADAALGGARRDEEKARAKERFFSHRDRFGQWDPKNQRPELWKLYNGRKRPGEHFRVFPLSNWTEIDIWRYVAARKLDLPSLYFSHRRRTFSSDGVLLAETPYTQPSPGVDVRERIVRFRTIGDATCTGAVESEAADVQEIIIELIASRVTERNGRGDDRRSEAAMEDRKKEGYF